MYIYVKYIILTSYLKRVFVYIIIFFSFLIFSVPISGQTTFKSQDELKKKANEYFKKGEYTLAFPLYSQLVSIYPRDPDYNYRFGVCLLIANKRESAKSIKYLEFAASKPETEYNVYYYLGLAYHNGYRFSEAIRSFKTFKQKATPKDILQYEIDRKIEICNNAKQLLNNISDLYVFEKTDVYYKDFFRSFDVERFGGRILVKPDALKTPLDKKKETLSLCFFSKETNELFFSSYGKDGKNGKDIYSAIKKDDGTWTTPKNLGKTINSIYDEDFPFLLSDGASIYFSSNGRNTMGGFDIFTSTLNEGVWTDPENLNYPINSPADDIMFVPDSSMEYAYFASTRNSLKDMISYYKIKIDNRPAIEENLVLEKTDDTNTINDSAYNETVKILQEKALLEVNATENMFAKVETTDISNKNTDYAESKETIIDTTEETIPDNLSNEEILVMAKKQTTDLKTEYNNLLTKKESAKRIISTKKKKADEKYNESFIVKSKAESISDINLKNTELTKAAKLRVEAEQLTKETEVAENIEEQLDSQIKSKQKEMEDADKYLNDINTALKLNSPDSSITLLTQMIEKIEKGVEDTTYIIDSNKNKEYIKNKEKEASKYDIIAKDMEEEIASNKTQIETYRKDASLTKKKETKEQLLQNALTLEEQSIEKQKELDVVLQKKEKIATEIESAKEEHVIYADILNNINNTETPVIEEIVEETPINKNEPTVVNNDIAKDQVADLNQPVENNTTKPITSEPVKDNSEKVITAETKIEEVKKVETETKAVTNDNLIVDNSLKEKEADSLKKEITLKTEEIKTSLQKQYFEIKELSDNAYNQSNLRNEQSIEKLKLSDNYLVQSQNTTNNQEKGKLKSQADLTKKEAVTLAKEAVVLFEMGQYYEDKSNEKLTENKLIFEKTTQIKNNIEQNKLNEASSLLSTLKKENTSSFNKNVSNNNYQSEIKNKLLQKENELNIAELEVIKANVISDSLKKLASVYKEEANNTTDNNKKEELLLKSAKTNEEAVKSNQIYIKKSDDVTKLEIEVGKLKMKSQLSTSLTEETTDNTNAKKTIIDVSTLKKQIEEYNNNNIFAEEKVKEEENIIIAEVNPVNTKVKEDIIEEPQIKEVPKTTTPIVVSSISDINNAEKTEAVAVLIDQTILQINNNISSLENDLVNKNTPQDRVKSEAEIEKLTNEVAVLTKLSSQIHNNAKVQNNNENVVSKTIPDSILIANYETDVENIKKEAVQKRINANSTTDVTQKEKLISEAEALNKMATEKQSLALKINDISLTNQYFDNTNKLSQVKPVETANNESTAANLLVNEAKYFFDKASALKKTINDSTPITQKKIIYDYIKTQQELAIQKQLKAIEIYSKNDPQFAQVINNAKKTEPIVTNKPTTTVNNTDLVADNKPPVKNEIIENKIPENTNKEIIPDKEVVQVKDQPTQNVSDKKEPIIEKIEEPIKPVENTITKTPEPKTIIKEPEIIPEEEKLAEIIPSKSIIKEDEIKETPEIKKPEEVKKTTTTDVNENVVVPAIKENTSATISNANPITTSEFKGIDLNTNTIKPTTNNDNLVPLNPLLPSGISYKVQIAAVRNHLAPETFKGISPITGERSPAGLIRYMAGLFAKFEDANTSKTKIQNMGYRDAFVVAYYNNKRITLAEARNLLKDGEVKETNYTALNNTEYISSGTSEVSYTAISTTGLNNPINNIKEVVYSVQVGVYKRPITSAQLFNISPLYDEIMTNGYYRYYSGTYNDLQSATNAKNAIVVKGVKDAFVVALYKGKKITIPEAENLIETTPISTEQTNIEKPINTETNKQTTPNKLDEVKPTIIFKVQIGAFKNEVPIEVVNQLLDVVKNNGLEHELNTEGLTVYLSGKFSDLQSANTFKETLINKGIADAFVVAFSNGERISINKAVELLK